MSYSLIREKSFDRDAKKKLSRDKTLKTIVTDAIIEINKNPSIGIPYERDMLGLIKYKIEIGENAKYRLIYSLSDCCNNRWENCKDAINCKGLIRLIFFKTREACNNLYYDKTAIKLALTTTTAVEKPQSS